MANSVGVQKCGYFPPHSRSMQTCSGWLFTFTTWSFSCAVLYCVLPITNNESVESLYFTALVIFLLLQCIDVFWMHSSFGVCTCLRPHQKFHKGVGVPPPLSSNILREPVLPYEAQSKWYHIDAPLFHVLFPKFPSHPCCSIPQSGVYAWALSHDQESRRDHWEGGWVVWELLQGRCHLSLNGQDKSFFKVVLKAFCFYLRVSLTCM